MSLPYPGKATWREKTKVRTSDPLEDLSVTKKREADSHDYACGVHCSLKTFSWAVSPERSYGKCDPALSSVLLRERAYARKGLVPHIFVSLSLPW